MELVANDIRVDREGVDVELMAVPWYAQTPKDIAVMYATCKYGKQYEELLLTTEHLGQRWYAMVEFCETRFTQSELKVYINFEKNYTTYRRTWEGSYNTEEEAEAAEGAETTVASTAIASATTAQVARPTLAIAQQ